jgi:hypothetical protein
LLLLLYRYKIYLFEVPGILLYSRMMKLSRAGKQAVQSHIVSHVSKKLWKRAKRLQVMILMNPMKIKISRGNKNSLLIKGNPSKKIQPKGQYKI